MLTRVCSYRARERSGARRDRHLRVQLQKERLTAFVVHDLKNTVNTMDLYAQVLLRGGRLSDEDRDSVIQMRTEATQPARRHWGTKQVAYRHAAESANELVTPRRIRLSAIHHHSGFAYKARSIGEALRLERRQTCLEFL
jgi:signal transduction histidine kinase